MYLPSFNNLLVIPAVGLFSHSVKEPDIDQGICEVFLSGALTDFTFALK